MDVRIEQGQVVRSPAALATPSDRPAWITVLRNEPGPTERCHMQPGAASAYVTDERDIRRTGAGTRLSLLDSSREPT